MTRFTIALAGLVLAAPAMADQKFDRSIDAAAARIVAERIGEIRGGFAPGDTPDFVGEVKTVASVAPSDGSWSDGLARAHDVAPPSGDTN
ncbi:hypothetical protein GN330_16185 [Nitratireductor sp. CAU 1489]|uniref:Uncharacterized protein n=1 Tax=Nitratireductor arenosus TaxID=2682096 RepID=A0A844QHW4_9HYPH|nr:hypothetical protein [Nitratireductor arenosus]MVA98787.1 hypothetical protein [Nitratireductor arenosus]